MNENIRRRMLDDKPIDDDDTELLSSFNERLQDFHVVQLECQAEAHTDDLQVIPAFPENFVVNAKAIVEALEAAVQVVKCPK